jgi:hypothetical protein
MNEEMKKKIEEEADQIMRWDWRDDFRQDNKNAIKQMITDLIELSKFKESKENTNYVTVEQLEAKYNIELRAYFKQLK